MLAAPQNAWLNGQPAAACKAFARAKHALNALEFEHLQATPLTALMVQTWCWCVTPPWTHWCTSTSARATLRLRVSDTF